MTVHSKAQIISSTFLYWKKLTQQAFLLPTSSYSIHLNHVKTSTHGYKLAVGIKFQQINRYHSLANLLRYG
ncbi:MAG TPA: hypothetical protein VK184_04740 [Nostocaceae cyanobacterium]|nr:hypothetical protein [Nostocaceae cyanobacterium]